MLSAYLGDGHIRITRNLTRTDPEDFAEYTFRGTAEEAVEFLEDRLIFVHRPGFTYPKHGASVLWANVDYVASFPAATLHTFYIGHSVDETRSSWKANHIGYQGHPQTWIDIATALGQLPQDAHDDRLITAYSILEGVSMKQAVEDLWYKNGNPRTVGRRGSVREHLERIVGIPIVTENIEELSDYWPWIPRSEAALKDDRCFAEDWARDCARFN